MQPALIRRSCATSLLVTLVVVSASAQTSWTLRNPTNSPTPRTAHGLAGHGGSQRVVLFGGCGGGRCFGDTWLWNGGPGTWARAAASGPTPRFGHGMVYDSGRDRIVVFGGGDLANNLFGDTWEWDGTRWQRIATSGPSPRWNCGMAYDPVRQRVVLYGGSTLTEVLGETWEWDGRSWTQRPTLSLGGVHGPLAPLTSPALAWDGTTGRILLYGGWDLGTPSVIPADTWAWDGTQWEFVYRERAHGVIEPSYAHGMTWDAARERVVYYGGTCFPSTAAVFFDGTFEWDGSEPWRRRAGTLAGPGPRAWTPLAYDSTHEQVVLFGGSDAVGVFGDTFTYGADAPATAHGFGTGCAGTSAPALDTSGTRPWLATDFDLTLTGLAPTAPAAVLVGVSRTTWRGLPLPLDLGALAVGCSILVSPDLVVPTTNVGGVALLTLPIPRNPVFTGSRFYAQGLCADRVTALGLVLSNGLAATVGSR
ncbi:MAG: kelch repeat-containing protein [Planctomycetota bacterium]